jgi:hypothetical protein
MWRFGEEFERLCEREIIFGNKIYCEDLKLK